MAEWAAVPSCANLTMQRCCIKDSDFILRSVHFRILTRKHFYGKFRTAWCPSRQAYKLHAPLTWKGSWQSREVPTRCCCMGTLMNPENAAPWISIVDQVLFMATVALAYMAGVIPSDKPYINARKNILDLDAGTTNSTSSGSAMKGKSQTNSECAWDEVRRKLVNALDVIEHCGNLDRRVVECEINIAKHPLSLHAIARGPRLRLLWSTLQQLQQEVNNVSGMNEAVGKDVLLAVLSGTVQASLQPACLRWLEEELHRESKKLDKALFMRLFGRLKGEDLVHKIKMMGKEDLYADFLFFLRFGSLRIGGLYDSKLLIEHGVDILEDLVITLADGIASLYLELISVDSNVSEEMNCLCLSLCSLSTRALQRLRNEVALNQWLHQNIESVASMYEDRFDLCTLHTELLEDSSQNQMEKLHWWKKLPFQKPLATSSPLCYVVIDRLSLSVKRTRELRALIGWRYYFSLFLEFYDITMPMVKAVVAKVSSAISFFLVCLIGRSLGLVYTGIRQALGWK